VANYPLVDVDMGIGRHYGYRDASRGAVVRHIGHDGAELSPPVPASTPLPVGRDLTDREREVLRLLADGLSNRQLATRLGISESTVARHVLVVMRKLDAASRAHAVTLGFRVGLLRLPEA
jgi:DNA-binding CsgD family transcriptional regulator